MKPPKVLAVILILLIIIVVAEVSYYIYLQNRSDGEKEKPPLANIQNELNIKYKFNNETIETILREASIAASMKKSGMLKSSVRLNRIETRLNSIDLLGGITRRGQTYKAKLELQNGPNEIMNLFIFSQRDLSVTKVVELQGDKETSISLPDLKPNDSIIIETKTDIFGDPGSNLIEMKITKKL